MTDFDKFCDEFDIVDNALQMRTLTRWNGRDLRERENLAEHTHLVMACVFKICDIVKEHNIDAYKLLNVANILHTAMLHDALELLRGDILTVTKDAIPGLRKHIDKEEFDFMKSKQDYVLSPLEKRIVKLADLMACYKFVEKEIRFPSNDFSLRAYTETKSAFDNAWYEFSYVLNIPVYDDVVVENRFVKGYQDDAGTDVVMDRRIVFLPMSTNAVELNIQCTPSENCMSYLCARTSAANKGLVIAQCPIDPNFTGNVTAIVHNISNDIITYDAGEAFCQVVSVPIVHGVVDAVVKKSGKRTNGKLGSTGGTK